MDFLLVFTPKFNLYNNSRFLVSHNTLYKYITSKNANKVILHAKNQNVNKTTIKFRKYGKIDIYLK